MFGELTASLEETHNTGRRLQFQKPCPQAALHRVPWNSSQVSHRAQDLTCFSTKNVDCWCGRHCSILPNHSYRTLVDSLLARTPTDRVVHGLQMKFSNDLQYHVRDLCGWFKYLHVRKGTSIGNTRSQAFRSRATPSVHIKTDSNRAGPVPDCPDLSGACQTNIRTLLDQKIAHRSRAAFECNRQQPMTRSERAHNIAHVSCSDDHASKPGLVSVCVALSD